jgi:RNA polymerase-binding transcription factor DksA
MMSKAELETYRQGLVSLLDRLRHDQSQLRSEAMHALGGEGGGGLSDVPLHPADLGGQQFDEDMTVALLGNEERIEERINAALARIEQGTFGRCESCGKEITRERLKTLPHTPYCLECAAKLEPPVKL